MVSVKLRKRHWIFSFLFPPLTSRLRLSREGGRERKEGEAAGSPSLPPSWGSQAKARLLPRRGQDEREIGFEMEVLDSTKPAFLLPQSAREMTESVQALATGQEAENGKSEAEGVNH